MFDKRSGILSLVIQHTIAIIFGLVFGPRGPWGVGIIVDVATESDACALGTNDPAVKAGLTFDVSAMPGVVMRK